MGQGRTALHMAALNGHTEAARTLVVAGGTPVDVGTRRGRTALHDACSKGQTDTAQMLLDLGADVNRRYEGVTRDVTRDLAEVTGTMEEGWVTCDGEPKTVPEGVWEVRRGSMFANSGASALHEAAEWGFEVRFWARGVVPREDMVRCLGLR